MTVGFSMITGVLSIGSLIWGNPILRYGALVLVAVISFKGWLWAHDRKVVAEINQKAEIHASKSIQAGARADSEPDPVDRLRKQYCRDC